MDQWSKGKIDERYFANPESARRIMRINIGICYVLVADNLCSSYSSAVWVAECSVGKSLLYRFPCQSTWVQPYRRPKGSTLLLLYHLCSCPPLDSLGNTLVCSFPFLLHLSLSPIHTFFAASHHPEASRCFFRRGPDLEGTCMEQRKT